MPTTLILFNKPFGVLSQFRTDENNDFRTLSDYFFDKNDKNLRVAGRLDATSEGLLLLTDNGKFNQFLTQPATDFAINLTTNQTKPKTTKKQGKTYWVQLDGKATNEQIAQLQTGVVLKDGKTLPAIVNRLTDEQISAKIWQAPAGIAQRKITDWLSITIFEGKNRQVRRMTAHVGLPCLRLIRVAHGDFLVHGIGVGEYRRLTLADNDLAKLGFDPKTVQLPKKANRLHHNKPFLTRKKS